MQHNFLLPAPDAVHLLEPAAYVVFLQMRISAKIQGFTEMFTSTVHNISHQLTLEQGQYVLTENAEKHIDKDLAFAMLINLEGQVIWSRNLPDGFPQAVFILFFSFFLQGKFPNLQ